MIFFITMLAYWGLGLPTGVILGLTVWICPKMGPAGFWIGFIVGLTSAALLLVIRMRLIFRQFAHSSANSTLPRGRNCPLVLHIQSQNQLHRSCSLIL